MATTPGKAKTTSKTTDVKNDKSDPGKDQEVKRGPTGTGSAKDQGKVSTGTGSDSAQTPLTPELYEEVRSSLKTANEQCLKLSEEIIELKEKKKKGEDYIVELKKDLKHKTDLVKSLRIELLKDTPDGVAKDPTPEEKKEAGVTGIPDGICGLLTCKKPFNVEDGLIKDETSRAFMSTRCPFCGKIQNAENARLRFAEAR